MENNKKGKIRFKNILGGISDRLFNNPSHKEQALFLVAVFLSALAFILTATASFYSKSAVTIIRAFTENAVFLILVLLLTVSDRFFIVKKASLAIVIFTLLSLARDCFSLAGANGIRVALAIVGILAGIAFYGTLFFDQFNSSDAPVKYWLIYGGALYKTIYLLISMIVNGTKNSGAGVLTVLNIIVSGGASITVTAMLVYLFDGFSFAKYLLFEMIDGSDDEPEEDETDNVADAAANDEYVPLDAEPTEKAAENAEADEPETEPQVIDDFGYVPYDESNSDDTVDTSVTPVVVSAPEEDKTEEPEEDESAGDIENVEADEADERSEPDDATDDDNFVLVDDELLEEERRREELEASEAAENETDGEPVDAVLTDADEAAQDADAEKAAEPNVDAEIQLSPFEIKYASFAIKHNKPDAPERVIGLSGDMFDVWVDGDVICFQNDIEQAKSGRGIRTVAIAFDDVENIGVGSAGDGKECIVLTYRRGDDPVEIGFTKDSFSHFKRIFNI